MTLSKHLLTAAFVSCLVACTVGGPDPSPSTSSSSSSSGGSSSKKQPSQDQDPTETTSSSSGGSSSGGSSSGGSSSGGTSKPSGATNVSCQTSDDCANWFCDCKAPNGSVSPVNAANCKNGWCMDAASSCPDACSAFGKTWTGYADGGPEQK